MKEIARKWEEWKNTSVGKEALLSIDKETSMFLAFKTGIFLAEKEQEEKKRNNGKVESPIE